jgi:hypothetical protein
MQGMMASSQLGGNEAHAGCCKPDTSSRSKWKGVVSQEKLDCPREGIRLVGRWGSSGVQSTPAHHQGSNKCLIWAANLKLK